MGLGYGTILPESLECKRLKSWEYNIYIIGKIKINI